MWAEYGVPTGLAVLFFHGGTMLALWESDGPLSMGDLGARLHLDSGTLAPLIKRLVHLGVVERRRDPADDRPVLVTLTEQGAAMRQSACDIPDRMSGRFGLDQQAAGALRDDLVRLAHTIEGRSDSST